MQNDSQEFIIPVSWRPYLAEESRKPYMIQLNNFLKEELASGKVIYPQAEDLLAAFKGTSWGNLKVVILGQDPYHGPGQAHGLCFSVQEGVPVPPSLVNIYKELEGDLGVKRATHGFLQSWAEQGVLLLNSVLTVEKNKAASHRKRGWEMFTDKVIEVINEREESVVFLLWGAYAQKKGKFINRGKHLVLETVHPSPLSAYRGFLGCKHFSQTNSFLSSRGIAPINWELPDNV